MAPVGARFSGGGRMPPPPAVWIVVA